MNAEPTKPSLKVGPDWVEILVIGPVDVVRTFRGYAPILPIRDIQTGLEYILYISAKSLMEPLEPLRAGNSGQFDGLRFEVRKQSTDKMAPYEIRDIGVNTNTSH